MELLAVLLVVFLFGVQVGQLIASWAIFYAITELGRGRVENRVYRLPGEVYDNDSDE